MALQSQTNLPPRILVVEDDNFIRQLSTESLILCGYQVDAAEDGAAGWEALNIRDYDLLITDNNIPKLSGFELAKKLDAAHMTLPVILMTETPPTEELKRHPWLQIDATLLKPFTIEKLLGTVLKVLRATDEAREQITPRPNWQSQLAAAGLRV